MTIGRYELLQEIARGGMAVLDLAREVGIEGFEKVVVVKRILPELRARAEFLDMFLDEARIAASLQHPNLPHVYELGCNDGEYFFAMEYLHGTDVRRIVKASGHELPLEHAVSIGLGLCAGLHYAHEKLAADGAPMNLVHRDVSPKNVFVTYDGGIKLLDFGIAKAEHKRGETSTGTLKGTVHYMSPEQIRGANVDRRTDVFAAAIVLWEATTGRRLFVGAGDYAVMNQILEQDAPRPSTVRADYPAELERIVMKGLSRAPAERFQTAEDLQLALEQFARDHRLATSPVGLARYMRQLFGDAAAAYQSAKEQGTLATRALVEISSSKREPEAAIASVSSASDRPPKPTRAIARVASSPSLARRWVPIVVLAGALTTVIAWRMTSDRTAALAPSDAATAALAPPPPPSPPADAMPAEISAPPAKKQVRRDRKPVVERPSAKHEESKPLTIEDLDAVLPPKK